MIIVEPCAGLGNRFIALASAYKAAESLGERLTVIWKSESVLGASMDELFSLPQDVDVVQIREFGYKKDLIGQIRGNIIKNKYKKMSDVFFSCDDIMNLYNEKGSDGVSRVIKDNKNVYIKATNPFFDIFDTENMFDFIKPAEDIAARRDEILKAAYGKRLVGVHIRRTDHIEAIKNSPLELFIDRMKDELSNNTETYFYVATDSPDTERELKEIFKDRIITFDDKCLKRETVSGIKDAYVEMLCLAAGEKIFGSFNSTFSLMASRLGNIPLVVVKKED